ncbi:MAG: hypothetical protein Q3W81_04730, partial [Slackia sp.]|nr:hypothetical protein [Slackia sp.]
MFVAFGFPFVGALGASLPDVPRFGRIPTVFVPRSFDALALPERVAAGFAGFFLVALSEASSGSPAESIGLRLKRNSHMASMRFSG